MTTREIANLLETRFKGDVHISIDTVKLYVESEIKPLSYTVLDVSHEYRFRMLKTTMQLKKGKFTEFYIKPI